VTISTLKNSVQFRPVIYKKTVVSVLEKQCKTVVCEHFWILFLLSFCKNMVFGVQSDPALLTTFYVNHTKSKT